MANWLILVVVGALLWIATLAPLFPAGWVRVTQAVGGLLIFVGVLILVLGLLGVAVAT
jgi:hypothetical protein